MLLRKIVLILLLTIPSPTFAEEIHNETLITNLLNSTVKINAYGENDANASGSGVIVSQDGLIITNYHVIHRAKRIKIWLYQNRDLRHYEATVLAIDPAADLALLITNLKEEDQYHVSDFEYEDNIIPGNDVIAVGHPLGLDWTVSKGTINALNRPSFITPYISLIQHDATINQGSSGGPLFNSNGNLIGINTYIVAPKEGGVSVYTGFGYAVQGDDVRKSLIRMATTGSVDGLRPAFKLEMIDLNDDVRNFMLRERPGLYVPNTLGLIIGGLEEDDWGYSQGLRDFDVIVSVDGLPVNNIAELSTYLRTNDILPGDYVYLLINREQEFYLFKYVLAELDVPIELYDRDRPEFEEYDEEPSSLRSR